MTTHPLWLPSAPGVNLTRQRQRIASRQTEPGPVQEHEPSWRDYFRTVEHVVSAAIGPQVLTIRHIGSTLVPGLQAKPVIDVDLTIPDVDNEPRYLPQLETAGFRLIFRDDMAGDMHRHLTLARPNTNLHIWNPGALEPHRHALFSEWLRSNASDRQYYNDAKAAATDPTGSGRYNDRKAAVVYDIYERAFLGDPRHNHDPQPRHTDAR